MPGPEACAAITDPKEKSDCLSYKGKYAKKAGGKRSRKTKGPMATTGGGY